MALGNFAVCEHSVWTPHPVAFRIDALVCRGQGVPVAAIHLCLEGTRAQHAVQCPVCTCDSTAQVCRRQGVPEAALELSEQTKFVQCATSHSYGVAIRRYADGKVCLSLLGTFSSADASERWNPATSSLFQVCLLCSVELSLGNILNPRHYLSLLSLLSFGYLHMRWRQLWSTADTAIVPLALGGLQPLPVPSRQQCLLVMLVFTSTMLHCAL